MAKSKLIKLLIPIILGFFVLTAAMPVQAGRNEIRNADPEQVINVDAEISASKKSYLIPFILRTEWEKKLKEWVTPYNIRVFIDGEEIKLLRFSVNLGGVHLWIFYHIFEPDYFEARELPYTVLFEFYYYNGYGQSRTQECEVLEGPFTVVE